MEKEPLAVRLQGAAIRALDRDQDEADMLRTAAEFVERTMDSITIRLDDIRPSFCEALIAVLEDEQREAKAHQVDWTDWYAHICRTLVTLRTLRESLG